MKHHNNTLVIERLTALWALNECGLGGLMHAFNTPFTGIIVGGISILLISLIAVYSSDPKRDLIKALSIVLLVKLSVSPHSPVTAYVAVSFQAFMGMLLYSTFSVNRITVVLLGALTFFESAIQKIITLTLIYGQSVWEAIDIYTAWINSKFDGLAPLLSSKGLILTYITVYVLAGILVGVLILRTIDLMRFIETKDLVEITSASLQEPLTKRKRKNFRLVRFWLITTLLILIALIYLNADLGGWEMGVYLVARSLFIIGIWYLIIGPLLLKALQQLLAKRASRYKYELEHTLDLLPHLKSIVRSAWRDSRSQKGVTRMQHFLATSIVYSVHFNPQQP